MIKADQLLARGEYAQAEPYIRQHLRSKPNDALAHEWLGGVLMFTNRFEPGIFAAKRAIELSGPETSRDVASRRYELLGNLSLKLHRFDEGVAAATRAIELHPTPHAYNLLAAAHLLREDLGKAFEPSKRAYELGGTEHSIVSNYAMLLGELGQPEQACAVLLRAMRERGHPAIMHALVPGLNYPVPTPAHERVADPLPASADDPDCVDWKFKRSFAESYSKFIEELGTEELAGRAHLHDVQNFDPERPLRVAIASYDIRTHSCSYFLRSLLKHFKRPGYTLVGVYTSPQVDDITHELKAHFDEWMHLPAAMPPEIATRVAAAKIDVLIECGGFTTQSPLYACAVRPAPVQVTYLGYPGTTGMRAVQYRIVDERTDPSPAADEQCSETLVRIPDCFLCFDPGADSPTPRDESVLGAVDVPRADGTLRPLVFGSFSTAIKLSKATYDQWCSVLRAVPNSTMLIKASILGTKEAADRALAQFAERGVDPSRVTLIARVPDRKAHLRIYDRMDIALDTYPYVGTTTICESLLMNVPYLSRYGSQHINRVGYSLLSAVGVPELTSPTLDGLVRIATELDKDRSRLATYQRTLRQKMMQSPVGQGQAYADKFVQAIRDMWRRECALKKA
jgi:Flp pilus assembly protein TadD